MPAGGFPFLIGASMSRPSRLALVIFSGLSFALLSKPALGLADERKESWILFLSHRTGNNLLYRMRPDGSDIEPIFGGEVKAAPGLPEGMTWYREPHWSCQSPDGNYFLSWAIDMGQPQSRYRVGPRFLIHLGRMEGGPTRLITPDALEVFAWAPDSRKFAFARTLHGHPATREHPTPPRTDVVVFQIDGSSEVVVLDRPGLWAPLDWTPDGKTLLVSYSSSPILQKARSAVYELDLVAAGGEMPRRRTRRESPSTEHDGDSEGDDLRVVVPPSTTIGGPSARYSPDGKSIAFIDSTLKPNPNQLIDPARFAASFELFLYDRATGKSQTIFKEPDVFGSPLCWSPDGMQILFARYTSRKEAIRPSREAATDTLAIWSIHPSGKELRQITTGWCPDWRNAPAKPASPASQESPGKESSGKGRDK
jgi:Tol biopolymer transport system component